MTHYTRPTAAPGRSMSVADMLLNEIALTARDSSMHYNLSQAIHDERNFPGLLDRSASLVNDLIECWTELSPNADRTALTHEAVSAVTDIQAVTLADKCGLRMTHEDVHLQNQIAPMINKISAELDAWETRRVRSTDSRYTKTRGRYVRPQQDQQSSQPTTEPTRRGRYSRNVDQSHDTPNVDARSGAVPLVRIKEHGMDYNDHRTAALAFETLPDTAKPVKADFWGSLAAEPEDWKEGFVGSDGIVNGDREYIALNAPHAEALMHVALNDNCSVLTKSGIIEYQYRRIDLVHLFKDENEFTTTIVSYPELQKLILDEHDLHGLAAALNYALESSSASLVTKIVSIINRRATQLVNRMVALDLGIKGLRISDFRADWKTLYEEHLIPKVTSAGIEKALLDEEISKYGEAVVERSIRIISLETPTEGSETFDYDTYVLKRANALLDTDLADRALVSSERISVTRLPVVAKDLGIRMDDTSAYVKASVTPDLYKALQGIVERISRTLDARLYDAILLVSSDDVKFEIILTDEYDDGDSTKPHFVLQTELRTW